MDFSIILLFFSCFSVLILSSIFFYFLLHKSYDNNKTFELTQLISEGLIAFIKRFSNSLAQVIVSLTVLLFLLSVIFNKSFSWQQIIAFILGSLIMSFCLFLGILFILKIIPRIIKANKGFAEESSVLIYRTATTISFIIISLAVIGLLFSFRILGVNNIIGYGVGIMLTAYLFRIGGGVYKTAADIGANIVVRLEKKVPKFDRRNPATLLDISGDFVGKVMGFSADIFSSFMLILICSILLPLQLFKSEVISQEIMLKLQELPFYIITVSILAAFLSFFYANYKIQKKHTDFLFKGIYFSAILCALATFFIVNFLNIDLTSNHVFGTGPYFSLFIPYLLGLLGTVFIVFMCDVLTSTHFSFSKRVAKEAEFGPVITILNGTAAGFKSIAFLVLFLFFVIMLSFYFADVYGISMAALGMLSVITTILITNIFASISCSITKILSLTNDDQNVIKSFSKIDEIGHDSASIGNGFASAAAVISVFFVLLTLILMVRIKMPLSSVLLLDGDLLAGLIIGVSIPFIFSGFLLRGAIKTILSVIEEVKRQFRDIPYLFEDKARPDIIKAVDKNLISSMNALIIPTLIMVLIPLIIGYFFEATSIKLFIGLICGTFLVGSNLGFYWANLGDSLNQARYFISKGNFGGMNTPTYDNILTADNFGDAFRDLLSPSINILIKSVGILTILIIYLLI